MTLKWQLAKECLTEDRKATTMEFNRSQNNLKSLNKAVLDGGSINVHIMSILSGGWSPSSLLYQTAAPEASNKFKIKAENGLNMTGHIQPKTNVPNNWDKTASHQDDAHI